MRDKKLLIILGVFLVILIGGGALVFTFINKTKEPISASEFKRIMEEKEFDVTDVNDQFEDAEYIKQVYVAVSKDSGYQIEFYELTDESYAINFFNNNKSIFESSKGGSSMESSINLKNYAKYSLAVEGSFKVVSRIDNTAIYLDVDSSNKDEVKKILSELGY